MQCIKISQMADDTCLFLKDNDSIGKALVTLNDFGTVSGLKTNIEKTKTYKLSHNKSEIDESSFNMQ